MKKGFTLVELAIVLVIVGLIIGGILVAKSMNETAKITSQIAEWQQLATAANNFKSNFNFLPGDDPLSTSRGYTATAYTGAVAAGNGDGYIIFAPGANWNGEPCMFFQQLKGFGLFPGTYGCHNGTQTLGVDYPAFMNSKDAYYFVHSKCATSACLAHNNDGNAAYVYLNPYPGNGSYYSPTWPNQPALASTVAAFDLKTDDGAPLTGNVTAMNGFVLATAGGSCINASSKYITNTATKYCGMNYKLDLY